MAEITWTGLVQCQRCQKTEELHILEAIPGASSDSERSVLIGFEKPAGWPSLRYCSRGCQLRAKLTETVAEKWRLEQELEGEE